MSHWKHTPLSQALEQSEKSQVSLNVALKVAQQRPGLLTILPDEIYLKGMTQLEQVAKEQGGNTLVTSEVTVLKVMAMKGVGLKKRRRRKKRVDLVD